MAERFAYSIFCDDIRNEDNGKAIFIGVYSGAMIVPSFPTTLPSFCIALTILTPLERPFEKMRIRIMKNDEELLLRDLPVEQMPILNIEGNEEENDDGRVQELRTVAKFNPFEITKETRIRVRVDTEDGEIRGGTLLIRTPDPSDRHLPNRKRSTNPIF